MHPSVSLLAVLKVAAFLPGRRFTRPLPAVSTKMVPPLVRGRPGMYMLLLMPLLEKKCWSGVDGSIELEGGSKVH